MNSNIVRGSAPFLQGVLNVCCSRRNIFLRLLFACALGGFWLTSSAATGGTSVVTPVGPATQYVTANSAKLIYGGNSASMTGAQAANLARTYGLEAADVIVKDAVKVPIGRQIVPVVAKRVVAAALLPEIAVAAVVVSGVIEAGTAIANYYEKAGISVRSGGGALQVTNGTTTPTNWIYTGPVLGSYGTLAAICQKAKEGFAQDYLNNGFTVIPGTSVLMDGPQPECTVEISVSKPGIEAGPRSATFNFNRTTTQSCMTGSGVIVAPTIGNVCDPGVTTPITNAQAADALRGVTAPNPAGVVEQAVNSGVTPEAGPTTITGPSTSPSPEVSTTTGPTGTTTTTTTNNYQYDGDMITYNTTTTTNVTNNAGDVISNTTTTETAPKDDRTECDKSPNTVGCAELDTPQGEIPKESKNVSFEAEDVLGTGSCPANKTMSFSSIGGKTATVVDWATFCDHALPVRGFVIVLASLTAFFIILPGGQQP